MINTDYYKRWKELDDKVLSSKSKENIIIYLSTDSNNNIYISNNNENNRCFYIEFDETFLSGYSPTNVNGLVIECRKNSKIDKDKKYLVVKNANPEYDNAFLGFSVICFNEMEKTLSDEETLYAFEKAIDNNHDFFSFRQKMSKEEEQGTLAELLFLEELINSNDESFVRFWFGSEKNKRDFIVNNIGIEIKSTRNQEQDIVSISNENQLDIGMLKKLYLRLYVFDENNNGTTLSEAIKRIYHSINAAEYKKMFLSKLSLHKIDPLKYESSYAFELEKVKSYKVDSRFPKLTKENIPSSAYDVKYKLNISNVGCEEIEYD